MEHAHNINYFLPHICGRNLLFCTWIEICSAMIEWFEWFQINWIPIKINSSDVKDCFNACLMRVLMTACRYNEVLFIENVHSYCHVCYGYYLCVITNYHGTIQFGYVKINSAPRYRYAVKTLLPLLRWLLGLLVIVKYIIVIDGEFAPLYSRLHKLRERHRWPHCDIGNTTSTH